LKQGLSHNPTLHWTFELCPLSLFLFYETCMISHFASFTVSCQVGCWWWKWLPAWSGVAVAQSLKVTHTSFCIECIWMVSHHCGWWDAPVGFPSKWSCVHTDHIRRVAHQSGLLSSELTLPTDCWI
jgi:hypothetical protein